MFIAILLVDKTVSDFERPRLPIAGNMLFRVGPALVSFVEYGKFVKISNLLELSRAHVEMENGLRNDFLCLDL